MYQVYIVPSLILLSEGFTVSDERFKELAKESGLILSLKEFESNLNKSEGFTAGHLVRILKPTKK